MRREDRSSELSKCIDKDSEKKSLKKTGLLQMRLIKESEQKLQLHAVELNIQETRYSIVLLS